MSQDVTMLHHLGVITRDMQDAVARYERLGFQLTPFSEARIPLRPQGEPEPLGAGNRCAIFQNNYLELLCISDPERWQSIPIEQRGPFDLDMPLTRYEGLHVMHFGASNLELVEARLSAQGIAHSEIRLFQRKVETPSGRKMMQAKTLHFPPRSNPEALLQIVQHLTPELVLQPRYMNHLNGARSITACLVCVEDPQAVANKYARYTHSQQEHLDGGIALDLGFSRVLVYAPEHLSTIIPGATPPALPSLIGFILSVKDLTFPRQLFHERHIPFQDHAGRLIIPPEEACGSTILFEQE